VTARLVTSLQTLTRIWRGERGWSDALRTHELVVAGPASVRRAVPTWLGHSLLAQAAHSA
jgi:hypothetical protein